MIEITRIASQKKNKTRYNIFIDKGSGESYGFSVDQDILVEFNLHKGLELDNPTVELLIEKDSLHKLYALAIKYLSYRMRSKQEIRDYLIKKEFDEEQIEQVIDRLVNENLLNDAEFANALVRTRITTTSKGPLLVKKELIDKGVAPKLAEQAIKTYSYEDQYDKAYKWVNKKLKTGSKKSFTQQIQSVQQTLMQKGFTSTVINDVLAEVKQEKDGDAEWDALVYQGEKIVRKYAKKTEGYELKHKVKAALYRKGFNLEAIDQFLDEQLNDEDF